MFICQTWFLSCSVCGSVSILARYSRKCFLGVSVEFLAEMVLHCGMVIPGLAGSQILEQGGELKQAKLILSHFWHCDLFFIACFLSFVTREKVLQNVEKFCFCHSRDEKDSRLSKILANGRSFSSSSCNFPQVPHLFSCRAAYLTLLFWIENYVNKPICFLKLLLPNHLMEKGQSWQPETGAPADMSSPFDFIVLCLQAGMSDWSQLSILKAVVFQTKYFSLHNFLCIYL